MTASNFDDIELAKFDKNGQNWWDKNGPFSTLHNINPLRIEWINTHIEIKGKNICDIGCGGGILSESMAKLGASVIGVDLSKNAIKAAKKHAYSSKLTIDYKCISPELLAKDYPSSFEVVTCLEILEHSPNPGSIIKIASNLVKKDGFVFFSTIDRNLKSYLMTVLGAEYLLKMLPKGTHNYEYFIRPAELCTYARNAGLEPLNLRGIGYSLLTKKFYISRNIKPNYLLVCQKK